MAVAKIDRISTLEATERYGVLVRLVRQARVIGLNVYDYKILFSALETAGIPAANSLLDSAPNLVLVERNPKLVDDGKIVDVDLVYEHFMNEGQSIDSPPYGVLFGEVRANINQLTTNLDENREPIVLEHTYPDDDPDFPGQTKQQGGEIEYFEAQRTLTVRGIKRTEFPWLIANTIVGAVNELPWNSAGPYEWICTACQWRALDVVANPMRHLFTFEFQHNADTWNSTAVFIDERTNRPPAGLVEGTGYKYIRKQNAVDFDELIGTYIQGA